MMMDEFPQRMNSPTPWIMTSNNQDRSSLDCLPKTKARCHSTLVAGLLALCFLLLVICVALSVMYPRPVWESTTSDYQNISERYITAGMIYNELKKDIKVLREHSVWLKEETERLNLSLVKLTADNNAMTVEATKLMALQKETRRQLMEKNVLLEEELSITKEHNQGLLRELELQRFTQTEVDLHSTTETTLKKCRDDWKRFQTKCYYFSSEMLTWNSSRAWCQREDADLVVINSTEEQEFIYANAQTTNGRRMWLGMSDEHEEGEWKWVDGSLIKDGVQYWHFRSEEQREPDNWEGEDPLGEDCGHIDTTAKPLDSWMDGSCKKLYHWICEMNI